MEPFSSNITKAISGSVTNQEQLLRSISTIPEDRGESETPTISQEICSTLPIRSACIPTSPNEISYISEEVLKMTG